MRDRNVMHCTFKPRQCVPQHSCQTSRSAQHVHWSTEFPSALTHPLSSPIVHSYVVCKTKFSGPKAKIHVGGKGHQTYVTRYSQQEPDGFCSRVPVSHADHRQAEV
eukprot:scaffold168026_cov34-Prasinocladus_malaysianus.AAC.3